MTVIKKPSLTILIPALNEEKNIAKIVKACLKLNDIYYLSVVVAVDNKTTDKTGEIAKKAGAKVIYIKEAGGKGTVIRNSLPYLTNDYVVQIDADYQFLPTDIPKLVNPLITNNADITLGTRYQNGARVEKGSVSFLKLLGSFVLSGATSIFARQRITDVMAGFKGFKKNVLLDLNPQTPHFGYEAELVIKASQKKYKILNVPITYKKRRTGKSNVNTIEHGFLVLQTIIKTGLSR